MGRIGQCSFKSICYKEKLGGKGYLERPENLGGAQRVVLGLHELADRDLNEIQARKGDERQDIDT